MNLNESQLPPVLFSEDLQALLGMGASTLRKARKRRNWPFSELPRISHKPRWSRDHVLAVISGQRKSVR